MNLKSRHVLLGIALVLLLAIVGGTTLIGAAPADCSSSSDLTGTLIQSGNQVTGTASNCTAVSANVGMIVVAAYLNPNGTVTNREIDRQTGVVPTQETLSFVSTLPECTVKVVLFKGTNAADPANQLAQRVFNVDKGNYCSDQPTPTTVPPTETPLPPTETPVPPTETPVPPTETPLPPTETPVPPTATPLPPTATPIPPGGGQGCTPGYWRQDHHFDSWVNYSPSDDYEVVFGVDATFNPHSLLNAVWLGGGGERAMARHAVAALLNASSSGVSYLYTEADVITMVQNAYATGNFEGTKNLFAAQNEMGCPLN